MQNVKLERKFKYISDVTKFPVRLKILKIFYYICPTNETRLTL